MLGATAAQGNPASQVTCDYGSDLFGRLASLKASKGTTIYQGDAFFRDAAGMLVSVRDTTVTQRERFGYDKGMRLVDAWTRTSAMGSCTPALPVSR